MRLVKEQEVFKNSKIADELQTVGVVKIPFLNEQELSLLRNFYTTTHGSQHPPTMYDGIHMTIWHSDLKYKLSIKEQIKSIVTPAFDRNFNHYRAISHQFIVKRKGNETTFPVHQDWSIVDEEKYFSLNIWIPLQDVDQNNGAMWIIKGSHRINRKIRGAGILFPDYYSILPQLEPYMTSFPMKAGEALIFYHSTIHGSPANQTDNPRVVVQVSLLPADAPLQIFFQKHADAPLEIHSPDDDFVFRYNKIREDSEIMPPTDQPLFTRPYSPDKKISIAEVLDAIVNHQP